MNFIEGNYSGKGKKVAVIISRFNSSITERLLEGAEDCFTRHELETENIDVYYVPGSFEIPFLAKKLVNSKKYDGILALSAVIRGETYHFEIVSNEVSKGVAQINLNSNVPVIFGVLTTDTVEQAMNRSGIKSGNKGFDTALSLLEMMDLNKRL